MELVVFLFLITEHVTLSGGFSLVFHIGVSWCSEGSVNDFKAFNPTQRTEIYFLENEIDGAILALMNTVEKIATVIPKLKYQLIFLKERDALLSTAESISTKSADSPSTSFATLPGSTSSVPMESDDHDTLDQSRTEQTHSDLFLENYVIPPLPCSLLKEIDDGSLHKFGPHFSNRQIFIETITHDLIDTHKLL